MEFTRGLDSNAAHLTSPHLCSPPPRNSRQPPRARTHALSRCTRRLPPRPRRRWWRRTGHGSRRSAPPPSPPPGGPSRGSPSPAPADSSGSRRAPRREGTRRAPTPSTPFSRGQIALLMLHFFFFFRRAVLVKEAAEPGGDAVDVTPEGFAVRSLAQEYGGGAFAVQGDVVVFSNYSDQRLYKQTIGGTPNKPRHCSIPYSLLWIIVGELDYSSSHCTKS